MNILMIREISRASEDKFHYVYIKHFNRLMYNKTKHKEKKWFCLSCLQNFSNENILDKHNNLLFNNKWSTKSRTK